MTPRAERRNAGKPRWRLVDFESLLPLLDALENGVVEYGLDNWKQGLSVTECLESCLRHTMAALDGERLDPKSGKPHTGHAMANLMFVEYMLRKRPEFDDCFAPRSEEVPQEIVMHSWIQEDTE